MPRAGHLTDHYDSCGERSHGLLPRGRGVSKAGINAPPGPVDEGVLQWREGNAGRAMKRGTDGALNGMLREFLLPLSLPLELGLRLKPPRGHHSSRAIEPWWPLPREPMARVQERELRPRGGMQSSEGSWHLCPSPNRRGEVTQGL